MREVDIGWIAGIFDGEGCLQFTKGIDKKNKNKPYIRARINIVNTDSALLEKFDELVFELTGSRMNRYIYQFKKKEWKDRTTLDMYKQDKVRIFLETILPYLTSKREKALDMLRYLELRRKNEFYSDEEWEIYRKYHRGGK